MAAYFRKAEIFEDAMDYGLAMDVYKEILKEHPNDIRARFLCNVAFAKASKLLFYFLICNKRPVIFFDCDDACRSSKHMGCLYGVLRFYFLQVCNFIFPILVIAPIHS